MTTKVFISYAKEDKRFAETLYVDLQKSDVEPWLDSKDLLPGQLWEKAIRKAISDSSYFLAVLSSRSVEKRGFVQKEVRYALEVAEEYNENEIFIIPVRIDECEPSFDRLKKIQRADFFPSYEKGIQQLLKTFDYVSVEKSSLVEVALAQSDGIISRLTDRGFGFIKYSYIKKDLFFHSSELQDIYYGELNVDDVVLFTIAEGPKGLAAVKISRA